MFGLGSWREEKNSRWLGLEKQERSGKERNVEPTCLV